MRGLRAFWSISIHAVRMPRFHREMAPWQSALTTHQRAAAHPSTASVHQGSAPAIYSASRKRNFPRLASGVPSRGDFGRARTAQHQPGQINPGKSAWCPSITLAAANRQQSEKELAMARPSTYESEFCERVIEYGKQGKSITWMAAELDVTRETIYEWMRVHPEFSDAITRAKQYAQKWWEDAGQNGMTGPGFNASVWSRSMAARFPEDWRENKGVELTGAGGGPVQHVARIELVALAGEKP